MGLEGTRCRPAEAPSAPAAAPAVQAQAPTKTKAKKMKKVAFAACVLGGKPIRPKVAALPKPPPEKEMFLGCLYQQVGHGGDGAADRGQWPDPPAGDLCPARHTAENRGAARPAHGDCEVRPGLYWSAGQGHHDAVSPSGVLEVRQADFGDGVLGEGSHDPRITIEFGDGGTYCNKREEAGRIL